MTDCVDDTCVKSPCPSAALMTLYVDDILLIGHRDVVLKEVEKLRLTNESAEPDQSFRIGTFGHLEHFLGVDYSRQKIDDRTKIMMSQKNYALKVAAIFLEASNRTNIRRYGTPLSKNSPALTDYDTPGTMEHVAPKLIGSLLWSARNTRPDIAQAVAFLGRFASRWCIVADKHLERIVGYPNTTASYGLVYWLHESDPIDIVAYVDADHGGCPFPRGPRAASWCTPWAPAEPSRCCHGRPTGRSARPRAPPRPRWSRSATSRGYSCSPHALPSPRRCNTPATR